MTSAEIRQKFIQFFTEKLKEENFEHVEVPSSCVVPENHPTLLFVNSGMVQFTPHFLCERDPVKDFGSKRLCSIQKTIRTTDLDIVGKSKYHNTFFEMMGSWSIGDYGKEESIRFAFDLLTNKEYGFGLDSDKLIPTVFSGSAEAECDHESIDAWEKVGISNERISKLPASENWWAVGAFKDPGPCGPCTEILYDRGPQYGSEEDIPGMTDNPRYLEIWNAGVFMQFNRDEKGKLHPLKLKSVDTGAGLERFALLLQGVDSVYETDLFVPIIDKIKELQKESDVINADFSREDILEATKRVADHVKAATFIAAEHIYPSNKDHGYVLRRLSRTVFNDLEFNLNIDPKHAKDIIPIIIEMYKDQYPEIESVDHIYELFEDELEKYNQAVKQARHVIKRKYLYRHKDVDAFEVYQSTGASIEVIEKIAQEMELSVDSEDFDKQLEAHQAKSRKGACGKFSGGLSGDDPKQRRLHTATHLLHQALREILGDHVQQLGSNITPHRLRFDFSHTEKMTDEEVSQVEKLVNEKIDERLPVQCIRMPREKAEETGALHFFNEKYGDTINIYYIGKDLDTACSKEFCGGPHVENTGDIGNFSISKQEGVGKGVRRIKATVA